MKSSKFVPTIFVEHAKGKALNKKAAILVAA
jgi:hypothetical protein